MKFIERHGPQSSEYLHAATSDTHRDSDTSRRQLQKLRAGGLLFCPRQQRATENAAFHPYIYDLAPRGRTFLEGDGLAEPTVTPSGHWVHLYMTACITASIDLAARAAGATYIPAHEILNRRRVAQAHPIGRKKLIPDQLFGLEIARRFRFFCVEADRGTEPKTTSEARKSHRSLIEDYRAYIGGKLYKEHLGLTAGMLLLVVFSSPTNERRFCAMVTELTGGAAWILTRTIEGFHGPFRPPTPMPELFTGDWNRAGHAPFRIDAA